MRQCHAVHRCQQIYWFYTAYIYKYISKLDYCSSVLAKLPDTLLQRLQSVLNAAARLALSARRTEHTTPLLRELHWLKVPERIQFRLCILVYHCLQGTAPSYLAETLQLVSDVRTRRHLQSAASLTLTVPTTRRTTLGDRAFPVTAARAWNALPLLVKQANTLLTLRPEAEICAV